MNSTSTQIQELIKKIEIQTPSVIELVKCASLAILIESQLLRAIRLKLLPYLDAGVEADLWFSPLVQSRGLNGIVLIPEVADIMRERLNADKALMDKVWEIIKIQHSNISPALQLEEKITWIALSSNNPQADIDAEFAKAISALVNEKRDGIAYWAARALPRLPEKAQQSRGAWTLLVASGTYVSHKKLLKGNPPPDLLDSGWNEIFDNLPKIQYMLQRRDDTLIFDEVFNEIAYTILIPDTNPRIFEIQWNEHNNSYKEIIAIPKGVRYFKDIGQKLVKIQTIDGKLYVIPQKMKVESAIPIAIFERKIRGHNNWVTNTAISPDSTWAVSGSSDSTLKTWDLETGQYRVTLSGHKSSVNSVAITPDGKRILSGSDDHTIGVWDATIGKNMAYLKGHEGYVLSIVPLPDNRRALSASTDGTLKLWDLNSGNCLKAFTGHRGGVNAVSVCLDGLRAVSGSYDQTLKTWDLETGQCQATLYGHSGDVHSVQITADGLFAVSGSKDQTVKLWDLETGTCRATFEGHKGEIFSVALSADRKLVASTGCYDNTVRLWDLSSGSCLQVIYDKDSYFTPVSATFSPDGSRLAVGNTTGVINIYRLTGVTPAVPAEPAVHYTNAKVVLLGDSGVGKSGLAYRLIEDRFIPTFSTHGMNVWRLDLPLAEEKSLEREALLWDLAGQEDYRLIHQLYLEETALALVLFNPQAPDPFAGITDWLKALAASSSKEQPGRPAKLLVAARTDVGSVTVSQKKIDRVMAEHGFAAYLTTSAKSGSNCSDSLNDNQPSALKQAMVQYIPWNLLPWTSTPRLLRELKNAVLAMKAEKLGLLGQPVLYQRLKQQLPWVAFGEEDVRTAVSLLANHGLVMPLQFGDLMLLQPELLNGYASAVIRAARAHTDEIGCVSQDDVFQRRIDWTGVTRLPLAEEDLLFRALVQTFLDKSLCIAEDTDMGKMLIFPSQYRRERDIPVHPEIFASYTFCGELATVYTTLVVRLWYGGGFYKRELWRNAAEFATHEGKTVGLLIERSGDGEGTIGVFFHHNASEDTKVMFSEYVHRHLQKYSREVKRHRYYVCGKCGYPVKDLEAVRLCLEAGREFIPCQVCFNKIPMQDRIEQRLTSEAVARRTAQMDEIAGQALDNQAKEQVLIGHIMALCGEANQVFRPVSMFDYGIDGEIEFKDRQGKPSGKKIYVQLKSGGSYLRYRIRDNRPVFDVKTPRHLEYWKTIPVDVYLVIRDEEGVIRWMNVTPVLKTRPDQDSLQLVFDGEKLDKDALLRVRDRLLLKKTATD